jgi:hypothetical protein
VQALMMMGAAGRSSNSKQQQSANVRARGLCGSLSQPKKIQLSPHPSTSETMDTSEQIRIHCVFSSNRCS